MKTPTHRNAFETHGLLMKNCANEAEYLEKLTALFHEVVNLHDPNDTGKYGDAGEFCLRVYARRFSSAIPAVLWISGQNKTDCTMSYKTAEGKTKKVTVEIKTACGEVNDIDKSHVIAYCPEFDANLPLTEQFYVFTYEQFMDMLNGVGYTGRGKVVHAPNARGRVNIQSFYSETRPKASKKLADFIWSCCMDCPNFSQWEKNLRG